MGLTINSTGTGAVDSEFLIHRSCSDRVIALAGNPNVGKSTVFNELTGLKQHTGNWPGKTVTNAQGHHSHKGTDYILVDLPGTYSLMAHSAEEEIARNFICFGGADAVVVVCDATCLERNLNLVLQTIEITPNVVVCVNLMDEAKKKNIHINLERLEALLGVPVVGTAARSKKGLSALMEKVENIQGYAVKHQVVEMKYLAPIEQAIAVVEPAVAAACGNTANPRWTALKLLDYDESLCCEMNRCCGCGCDFMSNNALADALDEGEKILSDAGIPPEKLRDRIVSCLILTAEDICSQVVSYNNPACRERERKIDKILTNKLTGIPIMIALLGLVFWITITGANYPSQWLSTLLFGIQDKLTELFFSMNAPEWLHGILVLGVYRVLAWVVSVMLPPMAIFFPIFTLLEDLGYLPRVAFNLDHHFKKACACGKQALTMCMVDNRMQKQKK